MSDRDGGHSPQSRVCGFRVGSSARAAVCTEGFIVPPNSLVLGVPARVVRQTTVEERGRIAHTVQSYLALQGAHKRGEFPER